MPMKSSFKLTIRAIKSFFGRYMALLLIVMLSVGFFAGLKITKNAMWNTCEDYLIKQHFYDFRLISTLGFSEDDVNAFSGIAGIELAEGGRSIDALAEYDSNIKSFKFLSLPENVNLPSLKSGRLPEADNECLADARVFDKKSIGTVIHIADENTEAVADRLSGTEFTIVGLAESPLYLGNDRGTTGIGNGALEGFIYLPVENFTDKVYTEINLTLNETAGIYSDEYDELIEQHKTEITETCKQLADDRYDMLIAETGLPPEMAEQAGIAAPETYVLTRSENSGYVSFENDTSIVSGIANIFPIFFIMIAMLVCITTMTRMVDEERTQIGVLKAMGFRNRTIISKYLLYAGSATLIGWVIGFFLGTWGLPQVFWYAYNALYDFAPLSYLFSAYLAVVTLAVSLLGILGSTWISCRKELGENPAKLIRPRTSKKGKRILLERFAPVWKRLSFLQKITLRNMFRYKRRLIMMLVGISCCTGLVVTAFGVRDSMIGVGTLQFEEIQKYDIETAFTAGAEESVSEKLDKIVGVDDYLTCCVQRVNLHSSENMNSVSLYSFEYSEKLTDFWDFHSDGTSLALPEQGGAIIGSRIAEKLSLSVGDSFEMQDTDMKTLTVTVKGVFDNYVDNFVIISAGTYADVFGEWQTNTALLSVSGNVQDIAEELTDMTESTGVKQLISTKEKVDSALSCLNYIIWLIVMFSGALAFIVTFNLTNINLAERSREVATVEVLGFYPKETESYVLRENLVLSVLAGFIGLPMGTLFHRIVMNMIVVDSMAFDIHITPVSYVLALICTVLFAVVVNLFMKRQIGKIQMAESLKAVE